MIEKSIPAAVRVAEVVAPEAIPLAEAAAARLLQTSFGTAPKVAAVTAATEVLERSAMRLTAGAAGTGVKAEVADIASLFMKDAAPTTFRVTAGNTGFAGFSHEVGHAEFTSLMRRAELADLSVRRAATAASISDESIIAGFGKAESMAPKGYKVLTATGTSPFAPEVKWSLPKQAADGTWLPGEWHTHQASPSFFMQNLTRDRAGLFIADNPQAWLHTGAMGGSSAPRVFEVQIGDVASARKWLTQPSYDFAAQRVRLLREISLDEVRLIAQ